jgi:hypothetical protein
MVKKTIRLLAVLSLVLCLVAPALHFWGRIEMRGYKILLASASAGWFVFATAWAMRSRKQPRP